MSRISDKPLWTDDLPDDATIIALIDGSIYNVSKDRFKGDTGATGAAGEPAATKIFLPTALVIETDILQGYQGFEVACEAGVRYLIHWSLQIQYSDGGVRWTSAGSDPQASDYHHYYMYGATPTNTAYASAGGGIGGGWHLSGLYHNNYNEGLQHLDYSVVVESDTAQNVGIVLSTNQPTGYFTIMAGSWMEYERVS